MRKAKKITLESFVKKLHSHVYRIIPFSETVVLILYPQFVFETIDKNDNLFQPTSQKVFRNIPSYLYIVNNKKDYQIMSKGMEEKEAVLILGSNILLNEYLVSDDMKSLLSSLL